MYPTAEAPLLFRDWFQQLLADWDIENICCAHMGVMIGHGHEQLVNLLNKSEKLFRKLSQKNGKKNPTGQIDVLHEYDMNIIGDECG